MLFNFQQLQFGRFYARVIPLLTKIAARIDLFTATNTYTSTGYTNVLNTTSGGTGTARQITFNKQDDLTSLIIGNGGLVQWASTTNIVTLGININSADYDVVQGSQGGSATGAYRAMEGEVEVIGLPAGTYTITGRIKVSTGSASLTVGSGGANYFIDCIEVPA